ncbi:hypothetical protein [Saccharothrix hoggarensis]|uniref:Uncharacterized protein n=1 Tax=Saccharothrix hoggarensis TaxID=913853 RepID=A0ABW3QZ41_9PSEU
MHGHVDAVVQSGTVRELRIGGHDDRRGVIALFVVVVLLVVAGVVVVWRVTRAEEPPATPLAVATDQRLRLDCPESGWVVPDRGDEPIPHGGGRPPADAVLGSGGEVVVTMQGLTGASVVVQSARVEVVRVADPLPGIFLPAVCEAGVEPRFFRLDLEAASPTLVPLSVDGTPVVDFPYRVNDFEPEQLVITPIARRDVEWRLHLKWTSGAAKGELVVDDGGKPLRTTGAGAARRFRFDTDTSHWRPES